MHGVAASGRAKGTSLPAPQHAHLTLPRRRSAAHPTCQTVHCRSLHRPPAPPPGPGPTRQGCGLAAPTVVPALITDYLTGYLVATGAVAALAERELRGGYYRVASSLARCATLAPSLAEPLAAEPYEPVRMQVTAGDVSLCQWALEGSWLCSWCVGRVCCPPSTRGPNTSGHILQHRVAMLAFRTAAKPHTRPPSTWLR